MACILISLLLSLSHAVANTTNSPPEFPPSESGERSVAENTNAGTDIGMPVTATDTESDSLSYTLGGPDSESFDIVSSTRQLRTKVALDHEKRDSYTVTVSVNDGKDANGDPDISMDDEITVTVAIVNVDEAGAVSLVPSQPKVGAVQGARLSDPDGGEFSQIISVSWEWAVSSDKTNWMSVGSTGDRYSPASSNQGMYLRATANYTDGEGSDKMAEAVSANVISQQESTPSLLVTTIASGLTYPWDLDFTPDGTMLFTERRGVLKARLTDGTVREVAADFSDLMVFGGTPDSWH